MEVAYPDFVPRPGLDREAMLAMQARIQDRVSFEDALDESPELVAAVDLAFADDEAVAAAVLMDHDGVLEESVVREPVTLPYIPGLLSFREAKAMLAALTALEGDPDLIFCDGNGRLHPREAGIATHVGVTLDHPSVGIAKSLLCGTLVDPPADPYPTGTRVQIAAGDRCEVPDGTLLGYAVQTRQWDHPDRHINPIYVSPGHHVSPERAVEFAVTWTEDYKLPEPIRAADRLAGEHARGG